MPVDSPHDLYGLPLDRFIPERAALVKALRGEQRRDEASEVAALRKPSVAAWAVNQLVRTQTTQMEALFAAGDDLVQAQADAAAGKPAGDALRAATRRQRDAVQGLVGAAEGLLSSDGHPLSQATLERVGDTLRAAAIDEEARRRVEDGCLAHELRFVGLGVGGLTAAPPRSPSTRKEPAAPPRSPSKRKEPAAAPRRSRKKADEGEAARGNVQAAKQNAEAAARAEAKAAARAEAEAAARAEAERRRKAALRAARQAEADARRVATRAEKELAAAQARRDEAVASLQEADRLLAAAQDRAEQAAAELRNAERAVSDLAGG